MDVIQILFVVSSLFISCQNVHAHYKSFTQDAGNRYVDNRGTQRFLQKYMLSAEVTCNDGSPAGFYMRTSNHSRMWIVFLEEGWCCYDNESCDERWSRAEFLMSSKEWPETKIVGGILSDSVIENPFWSQANHVFVPYCTSDIWSGRRSQPQPGSRFTFMGSIVIKQVIRELLTLGLANAKSLILSGSSAGGVGVMLNLDPIQKMLRPYSGMSVHGITDSGWFVDQKMPYAKVESGIFNKTLSPIEAVQQGIPYWHSQIPSRCRNRYVDEPFKCFIGYKIYPTLTVPLFVFQWLFDEFQLKHEVGVPETKQQWDHIHKMGTRLRKTMLNVKAVFAPSCVSHSVLTKKDWMNIKINSVSLPQALHCWQAETRLAKIKSRPRGHGKRKSRNNDPEKRAENETRQQGAVKKLRMCRSGCAEVPVQNATVTDNAEGNRTKRKRHSKNPAECRHQHIQGCTWPQCNETCPKLHNPVTGEEVDFIELLESFGMNIPNLSTELGIDIDSLTHMDQGELLTLINQYPN